MVLTSFSEPPQKTKIRLTSGKAFKLVLIYTCTMNSKTLPNVTLYLQIKILQKQIIDF